MTLRSFLRDMLDDGPRYSDRAGPVMNSGDIAQTPLPEITRNSSTWDFMFGGGMPGLPAVTEQSLLQISTAYACVNLIGGAISALPANVLKRQADGEREQLFNDDLWWLLNEEFNPRWAAASGWEYLMLSLLFQGDGFATIIRRGAVPVGLEPSHPRDVTVLATADRQRLVYAVRRESGRTDVVDQDDMLHFPGFGFDGFRGVSPIRHHLRMAGSVSLAAQEYAARFFANGARPDILLTSDQQLSREQADLTRELWEEQYGGLKNAHRPAVLGAGVKAQPLTLNAQDAQLLESRKFSVEDIARIFGVPAFMIGHTEKTTSFGKGIESMGQGFVRFTLRQHLNKIQGELNRKLLRRSDRFIEFDTFELERADMQTLFQSFRVAMGRAGEPGFMTAEEVRQKLNLKRQPDHGTLSTGERATKAQAPAKVPTENKTAASIAALAEAVSERPAPVVNIDVHMPKRASERTVVTKHTADGRVAEFERREIEDEE